MGVKRQKMAKKSPEKREKTQKNHESRRKILYEKSIDC